MACRQSLIRSVVAAVAVLTLGPVSTFAQEAPAQSAPQDLAQLEQGIPTAPVMVDGVTILRVRGVSSFPAEQRAKAIADRIRGIAANHAIRPEAVRIEETGSASQILADGQLVMNVYDVDGAWTGSTLPSLTGVRQ